MRALAASALIVLTAVSVASCTSLLGSDYRAVEATDAAGGSSEGGGGASSGGVGGSGGAGGDPTRGGGGVGGVGGAPPLPLEDEGLVARYFLDEADSGTGVPAALDAAPDPFDLFHQFAGVMSYVTGPEGNRALEWTQTGSNALAGRDIAGSKIEQLQNATRLTMEVVVRVDAPGSPGYLLFVGPGDGFGDVGAASIRTTGSGLEVAFNDDVIGTWPAPLTTLGRFVVHVVLDTEQASEQDRVRVHVDGGRLAGTVQAPFFAEPTLLFIGDDLVVGNRGDAGRSIRGRIHYAALYSAALTPAQLDNNVAALLANDDTPPSP